MPLHSYTASEMSPLDDVVDIQKKAIIVGYSGISVTYRNDADGEVYEITIAGAVDRDTLRSSLVLATVPTLSLSTNDLQIPGDGVTTGVFTVSDSRGAGASGKPVLVRLPPNEIALSPSVVLVLNSAGQGEMTFGPSSGVGVISGKMPVSFSYAGGEANTVECKVSYV